MCIHTDGTERPIPSRSKLISDNGISRVWLDIANGYIFKRSIPFLIENEFYFLQSMWSRGFAPSSVRWDKYTIQMTYLGESDPVTDKPKFRHNCKKLLEALKDAGIRHGDLTEYAIIVKNNHPYVIDFAESRFWDDPRPDKRLEGDKHWLWKSVEQICQE